MNPENEVKQLQIFLPRYKSYFNKYKSQKKPSIDKEKSDIKAAHGTEEQREEEPKETIVEEKALNKSGKKAGRRSEIGHAEDESMEGYGEYVFYAILAKFKPLYIYRQVLMMNLCLKSTRNYENTC